MKIKIVENKKIFFWGSKPLGLSCLSYLNNRIKRYKGVKIEGVCISTTDQLYGSKIKKYAQKNNIPVYTELQQIPFKYDLGLCIGYPHKISGEIIKNFKNGIINLHFAPLPHYRGSKTLNHAILNSEEKYGVTFHYINETLDTGPIIDVCWYTLPTDLTAMKIIAELERLSLSFFKEYIDRMLLGKLPSVSQEERIKKDMITPKFYTRDSLEKLYKISMEDSFEEIYKKVRALQMDYKKLPYIEKNGKKIYLSIE